MHLKQILNGYPALISNFSRWLIWGGDERQFVVFLFMLLSFIYLCIYMCEFYDFMYLFIICVLRCTCFLFSMLFLVGLYVLFLFLFFFQLPTLVLTTLHISKRLPYMPIPF